MSIGSIDLSSVSVSIELSEFHVLGKIVVLLKNNDRKIKLD